MGTKSKSLVMVIVALFLTSLVVMPPATVKAQSKTIVVPDDYQTIQSAIDHANAGDTVHVKKGTYNLMGQYAGYDALIINKPISLIGENNEHTIITTEYWKYISAVIKVNANGVTISGFNVSNGGRSYGIFVAGSDCKLLNNRLDCVIYSIGNNNLISGNIISNVITFGGIICEHANSVIIMNNTITNCGSFGGIWVDDSNNTTLKQNNIMNNSDGITIGFYLDQTCNNTIVRENSIVGNGNGVVLGPSDSSYIDGNIVADNLGAGVNFNENCNNASIYGNIISRNSIGFRLTNQSQPLVGEGNSVYYNNIVNNRKNVVIDQVNNYDIITWDNSVVGNYWSGYFGLGSYVIDQNNIDYHPLTQQVAISSTVPTSNPTQLNITFILPIVFTVLIAVVVFLLLYRRRRKPISQNKPDV